MKSKATLIPASLSVFLLLISCKTSSDPSPVASLDSFTPAKGVAGSTITITGKAFASNTIDNKVTIDTIEVNVLTATPEQLTVSVPAASIGGKISIVVRGVTVQSATDFVVTDRWEKKADVGGKRDFGFCFAANGKGYVGAGSLSQKDFWEYDPVNNVWTQMQDFKGETRVYSTGFGIGSKGYVTSGLGPIGAHNDIWQYDPSINNWTQKNDLPFSARFAATSFVIGTKAYLGSGTVNSTNLLNDFWEYDSENDSWNKKADIPGDPRVYAFGLTIGSKGYIGGGRTRPGDTPLSTFYEYNVSLNEWTKKSDSPQEEDFSYFSNSFATPLKGYISGATGKHLWQFDPAANSWLKKADPPTQAFGVGFIIGEYGYLGASYEKNFYRYIPE